MRILIVVLMATLAASVAAPAAAADPIRIVAAENFYGDTVRPIGGANVSVKSILSNPDQDPHEFEARVSTAREIADAHLFVYNGADYDPWADRLLSSSPSPARETIEVAQLLQRKPGDNPHLWYDPAAMPALAAAVASKLARLDPAHSADYERRLQRFRKSMEPLEEQIAELRRTYAGTPVTASEPVFGYMADALGLAMRNRRFQLAVMNDTEPSAADIAGFEKDLKTRAVAVLLYNSQTAGPLTERMRRIAEKAGVPVVGVTETEPAERTYQEWMASQLETLSRALARWMKMRSSSIR
jgi:zinc/manganese transport system substrate-binding protein